MKTYVLNMNNEVEERLDDGVSAWKEMDNGRRIIGRTQVGDQRISTVFLVIDHSFSGGPPILFESMIFGGKNEDYQERYHTYQEAIDGHLKLVKACINDEKIE